MKNWVVLCTAAIVGGSFVLSKHIEKQKNDEPMTISVTADESVSAAPTIAEMNFGVTTERHKTATEAMTSLSSKMKAAFEAAKANGIKEKEIGTHSLVLQPAYEYDKGKRIDQGFEASQTLHVKVCDLSKVGTVLQAAVQAGANQAGGIRFTVENTEALVEQAKAKATDKAKKNAEVIAQRLGKRLGNLKGYSEQVGMPNERQTYARQRSMADSPGGPPTPAGEQEIRVIVSLNYELK